MGYAYSLDILHEALRGADRRLPGALPSLGMVADRLAYSARAVLVANDALLLSVTGKRPDFQATLTTSAWSARCEPRPLDPISPDHSLGLTLAALEAAAGVLLSELVRRWPANALPPAIGILTDGCGVAFSSDNPSPLSSDWLAKHQSDHCPITVLLPFAADSSWTRLTSARSDGMLH